MGEQIDDMREPGLRKPEVKILVVDDREDNLLSIETILEREDYIIRKANSGRNALKILLHERDFTLILMDVQMPDLNGFETATMIYESNKLKHIPIIFITAHDRTDENIFRGYQLGGIDYLYKPVNPDLLRAKVTVFVELYNKNFQLTEHDRYLTAVNKKLEKEIAERKVSERKIKDLNRQLEESITELQAKNEELEQLTFGASHDLQEPLRKITLFATSISKKCGDVLDPESAFFLERLLKSSERMQKLVDNLLAFSKLGYHNNNKYERVNLQVIVDNVVSDLAVAIEKQNAVVRTGSLPLLKVIPNEISRVFQNLIINALKFSKPGVAPEISIYSDTVKGADINGAPAELADHDYCNIYVKDNGIGFDQQYADQIFIVFKRLHSYDAFEGSGIGLSICKRIVEKHNGFINAVGEADKGAIFIISLPMDAKGLEAALASEAGLEEKGLRQT